MAEARAKKRPLDERDRDVRHRRALKPDLAVERVPQDDLDLLPRRSRDRGLPTGGLGELEEEVAVARSIMGRTALRDHLVGIVLVAGVISALGATRSVRKMRLVESLRSE